MGSVYKKKGGKHWCIRYTKNGKRYFENSKSELKTVAQELLKVREGEIAQGKLPGKVFEKTTFEALCEDLLVDYQNNDRRSIRRVEQAIKHLQPYFGKDRAVEVSTDRIKKYTAMRIKSGASKATINRELSALKRMFSMAFRECTPPKVREVPFIPMLEEPPAKEGFFEHYDFIVFYSNLPEYVQPLVMFGYKLGCRLGELQNLTWDRVNRQDGYIRLEAIDTKSKTPREIHLDGELRSMIKKLFTSRRVGKPDKESYVFHRHGKRIKDFRKAWNNACEAIGRKGYIKDGGEREDGEQGLTFHDLRRTALRNMIRAGVSQQVAMMISGHKTANVFKRYNITTNTDLKEASLKVESYLLTKRSGTNLVPAASAGKSETANPL